MNRLSVSVGVGTGLTFEQAKERGELALAALSGAAAEHVSANIARLTQSIETGEKRTDIHRTALEICSISGMFGNAGLSTAAKLLADLVKETEGTTRWSPQALLVFVGALRTIDVLGGLRAEGAATEALLMNLNVLASRVLAGKINLAPRPA